VKNVAKNDSGESIELTEKRDDELK